MNSMENTQRRANYMNRLMKWPLLCGLLSLTLAQTALMAGDFAGDTYVNNGIVSYPGTETHPPMIDAINFVNNNSFSIDYQAYYAFYETWNTINYNNTGTMAVNTGFYFDTQTTNVIPRQMAGSFNNSGTISCGYISSDFLYYYGEEIYLDELYYYDVYGSGIFNAWATNIVNSGTVNIGGYGLMQFAGQNVDLSRSKLNMEAAFANISGTGVFGVNTNGWDPSSYLWTDYADSAFFPIAPYYLDLTNSTAFMTVDQGASNNIIRAVFIQDTSDTNISYNVYFNTGNYGLGNGSVTIEWVGSYLDVASGTFLNNYLYLNNDYVHSTDTNVVLYNGIPDNFTFTESKTRLLLGATNAAGFAAIFPAGSITNRYAFANATLISTTESTNDVPDHSITNMPGRIQIYATNELNLSLAQIIGQNYLAVQSTNQFDGSAGARIQSPYSDFNLGVTNGFLTISNLMEPQIPNWNGNVQAWSTRWLAVENGVTNDYRVLIVGSQLTATTLAQVQDLFLHGTNSIVVSDTLNVIRNFSADAQNLTLTTNGAGVGATSLDGELNLNSGSILWSSALPNLRNLTNSGAIRTLNQVSFGNPASSNGVATIPAAAAIGILSRTSASVTNVSTSDKLIIGTNHYAFVSQLTNTVVANRIKIATTFDGSMSNLVAAINCAAGSGTSYSTNTIANPWVAASIQTNHAVIISARIAGLAGNTNQTLTSYTNNVVWNNDTLSGGKEAVLGSTNVTFAYDNFINNGLVSDQASVIYANNFVNSGVVSNGIGSFLLHSLTTTLTNGLLTAGGDVLITADTLVMSNLVLQAGRSLTLQVTNLLTDNCLTNGNIWTVGAASVGTGISLPIKPSAGDLLGTTITNIAPVNTRVINTWAGTNFGLSTSGYTNNAAVGRLILDVKPSTISPAFVFNGTGTNNALYVDYLELRDYATNGTFINGIGSYYDFSSWLTINTNLVIYFAQAVENGVSVAENIDYASRVQGANGGRLRWIPAYVGHFSSTNLVYAGVTNTVNAALAASKNIDSDGDGIYNYYDTTPFFVSSQMNFNLTVTNLSVRVQWTTVPNATNSIYYRTNLTTGGWLPFTNFGSYYYGNNLSVPNATQSNTFVSPQVYPSPAANVWVFDAVTNNPHYYRVLVQPATMYYPN